MNPTTDRLRAAALDRRLDMTRRLERQSQLPLVRLRRAARRAYAAIAAFGISAQEFADGVARLNERSRR